MHRTDKIVRILKPKLIKTETQRDKQNLKHFSLNSPTLGNSNLTSFSPMSAESKIEDIIVEFLHYKARKLKCYIGNGK